MKLGSNSDALQMMSGNGMGKIITTVGGNAKSLRNLKDVLKMLNNNGEFSSLPSD